MDDSFMMNLWLCACKDASYAFMLYSIGLRGEETMKRSCDCEANR